MTNKAAEDLSKALEKLRDSCTDEDVIEEVRAATAAYQLTVKAEIAGSADVEVAATIKSAVHARSDAINADPKATEEQKGSIKAAVDRADKDYAEKVAAAKAKVSKRLFDLGFLFAGGQGCPKTAEPKAPQTREYLEMMTDAAAAVLQERVKRLKLDCIDFASIRDLSDWAKAYQDRLFDEIDADPDVKSESHLRDAMQTAWSNSLQDPKATAQERDEKESAYVKEEMRYQETWKKAAARVRKRLTDKGLGIAGDGKDQCPKTTPTPANPAQPQNKMSVTPSDNGNIGQTGAMQGNVLSGNVLGGIGVEAAPVGQPNTKDEGAGKGHPSQPKQQQQP